MSADWPVVRLGDYCEKIGSGATPRGGSGVYLEAGEIFLIRSQNVYNDGFKEDGLVFITADSAKKLKNVVVEENDILLNITGDSVARVCLAKKEYLPARVNQHVAIIRPNKDAFDSRYLRYLLASPAMQNLLLTIAGAGATRNALTKGMIESLEVIKPPLKVQAAIADNLESLDDKIDLNRQTNQTLEQIAQAIFKSWFVDFDPVRAKIADREAFIQQHPEVTDEAIRAAAGTEGDTLAHAGAKACELAAICAISGKTEEQLNELDAETLQQLKDTAALFPNALEESELGEVPEGWLVGTLGDLIEFNPKRVLKKGTVAPYLDMKNVPTQGHQADDVYDREMGSGSKFINGDTLLARITPCLENGKTAYVDFLPEGQVGWGSTEYIIMRPKDGRPLSLGYLIARMNEFRAKAIQSMTGTSGRQRADAKAIADLAWINYPYDLLKAFEKISDGYLALAKQNGEQNKVLVLLRDALLPKLLSGELTIEKAATNKEAVA